jgi:Flp pilus assembly protein protease CpaA
MIDILKIIFVAFGLGFSCFTDVKYRKIKNYITFPLMIIGIILNIVQQPIVDGLLFALQGIGIMFLVCILMSIVGGFGFGDTKLLMGVASVTGWWFAFDVLLYALLVMVAYFIIFKFKMLKQAIKNLFFIANSILLVHKIPTLEQSTSAWTVPYACFISVGYFMTLLYTYFIGGNLIWTILN